nr:MAG TPA: hypothetical protein [Caudoviricetes sp.]
MKAYKGFDRNMRCRGFQFEEGKTYEEDKAELCSAGFHACESPLDVWNYYSPADGCQYHEVELEDVSKKRNSDDSKVCGKRIRIGSRLGIKGIVNAFVSMCIDNTKGEKNAQGALINNDKKFTQIGSSGNGARIGSSGNWAQIGSSGNGAQIGSSGNGARIGSSGNWARIGSSGNGAQIGSTGYTAQIETLGTNCVMMCAGQNGRAKGKIGSWIVLTEWVNGEPNVVAKRIDGALVKADTWYVLRDGQMQEVEADE